MSYSARGRYRAGCSCATESGPRDSKVQVVIFQLLSFVLGGGRHDVSFPEDRRMEVDMVFDLAADFRLAIEYDGAYWHHGKEATDARKSELLVWSGFVHQVMRLREEPLRPITSSDLPVAKGAPPAEVAQLALLHILHEARQHISRSVEVEMFLRSAASHVDARRISCHVCWELACDFGLSVGVESAERLAGWRRRRPRVWRSVVPDPERNLEPRSSRRPAVGGDGFLGQEAEGRDQSLAEDGADDYGFG